MADTFFPADWAVPIAAPTLTGKLVQLEPLAPSHLPELTLAGSDPRVWEFTTSAANTPESMRTYVAALLQDWQGGSAVPFIARRISDSQVIGCTRLKELDRQNRRALVGSWYAPAAWRSGANLEAKHLLLDYAFANLGCIRIEFHTDACNQRSRESLQKLGATFEGILRAHQITREGKLRDSAIYSILQCEWPSLRERILDRLQRSHPGGE